MTEAETPLKTWGGGGGGGGAVKKNLILNNTFKNDNLEVETQLKGYSYSIYFYESKKLAKYFFRSSYLKTNSLTMEGKSNESVRSLWMCSNS